MYLPRREMIGALITKKQSNQIILKNFQIEKIMKNLQINLNSPMAVTKGVLMNALLDVNFNLSSIPFQKEKKDVPFSYEESFFFLSSFQRWIKQCKNVDKLNKKFLQLELFTFSKREKECAFLV